MTADQALILPFSEIRAGDLSLVGGKGANLGEMVHAGFPVPPGFCLTTLAFEQFIAACSDLEDLYRRLDRVAGDDLEAARGVGQVVRQVLLDLPMPTAVAKALRQFWRMYGNQQAYAVRSSATAEDQPEASFAGQQETYLNILDEAALLEAVQRCWVSLYSDRAILYRAQHGYQDRDVRLAVVIQQMIQAEKAGVLFTADPLTGHRQTMVIDASFGLGEALVSGLVTPDAYRVDKRSMQVLARQIADKEVAVFPHQQGGTRQVRLADNQRRQTVLSDDQILELAALGAQVENHYRAPQDLEWGWADGRFFLLQTRPITALYPVDGLKSSDNGLHIYLSMGHQQSMTRAMAPLSISNIQVMLPVGHRESRFDNRYARSSGGRIFADLTPLLRHPILRRGLFGLLAQLDARAPEKVRQAMRRPEFQQSSALRLSLPGIRGGLKIVRRVLRSLWRRDLTGFVDQTNALIDEYLAGIRQELEMLPPGAKLIQSILERMRGFFPYFLNWVPEAAAGMAAARILPRLAQRWLTPDELEALTLGIPGNVVNEMNLEIGDLADRVRIIPWLAERFEQLGEDGSLWIEQTAQLEGAGLFLEAWSRFIARYGSRGPSEIDISKPRWYEEPLPVLRVIAQFLQRDPGRHREIHQDLLRKRQSAMEKLRTNAGKGLMGRIRLRLLDRLYYTMTEVGGMREHHKFMVVRLLAVIKELLKKDAARLVAAGKLARPDDLWFLTWEDLAAIEDDHGDDWRRLVTQRRAEYMRFEKLTPPLIVTSDGEAPIVHYQVEDAPAGALLGNPVSPGVVEGIVHVIRDPQQETLLPGEILVAEFTDPGWTPLFINAGGLILEVGGALTHGAVIAREYGIPAVVGVPGALETLQSGQRVRLDGNRGIIEIQSV